MTLHKDGNCPQAEHHSKTNRGLKDLSIKAKLFRLKKIDPHQDSSEIGNDESQFKVGIKDIFKVCFLKNVQCAKANLTGAG